MFSSYELRLIRYSVTKTMENLKKRLQILDPESEEAVETINNLASLQIIIEKINDEDGV